MKKQFPVFLAVFVALSLFAIALVPNATRSPVTFVQPIETAPLTALPLDPVEAPAEAPAPPAVVAAENRFYAPQLTAELISKAKTIRLHLDGIHATTEVDSVRLLLLATPAKGNEIQAEIATLSLRFKGGPREPTKVFDVTAELSRLTGKPKDFRVAFYVTGPNQRQAMDMHAFDVEQTYFELIGADGNPIAVPK